MISNNLVINSRYKTIKRLGIGGMGEVWKCEDLVLKRSVALKFVNEGYSRDNPDSVKLLQDEARLGAKLIGHCNIITVLDYGVYNESESNIYYIVMEYVEGINLQDWIDKYLKKFDKETVYNINLFIAREICKAIEYAHLNDVLHRDIKPLNIFLSKMGRIKIGDFGIGRFMDEATRTHTMYMANTPLYCSPEQWNGEKPTKDTETYQIGCTLYQLFTGKLPYDVKGLPALIKAHLNDTPKNPKDLNNIISEEISSLIIESISKEKEKRPSLWEINDAISREIQSDFAISIDIHDKTIEDKKLVSKLTDFDIDDLKDGVTKYVFPDFYEALSEFIQLVLIGIEDIKVFKVDEKVNLKVATTKK